MICLRRSNITFLRDVIHERTDSTLVVVVRCAENAVQQFLEQHHELLGYERLHGGICFVAYVSFFRAFLDIPTQIPVYVLTVHLGYCARRYCDLYVKNGFPRRLRHVTPRLFD